MKWNSIAIAVLGIIVVVGAALVFLQMSSNQQSSPAGAGNITVTATPVPQQTKADVLDKFSTLRSKINASGLSYGGAAIQLVNGEETAMVYIYKSASSDVAAMLSSGFDALYSTFETKDPLLVGIVDTTQKINEQQFKVDIYALERSAVADYLYGNMTSQELQKKALVVTPETASLRPGRNASVKKSVDVDYKRPVNYTAPANRSMVLDDYLEQGGYSKPAGFQAGAMSDGTKAVSVTMPMKAGATPADKYAEIETVLKACAAGYGDYDRYMISLMPSQEGVYDYYSIDASAPPVIAFANGDIGEYQLFKAVNMTYYTK
jgi:apolipoprotein N-acyltransferase